MRFSGEEIAHLNSLPEDEQRAKIRQRWLRLIVNAHPDKNNDSGANNNFHAINDAYNALISTNESNYPLDFDSYFNHEPMQIPKEAFDLRLQTLILDKFDELKREFLRLNQPKQKERFARYYSDFFNLAKSLESQQSSFNKFRTESLYQQQSSLSLKLKREWRKLILMIFAEEYLDDFQYRYAIGTGDLPPILATRKLMSPIKLLVAFINSLILVVNLTIMHYLQKVMSNFFNDFSKIFNDYKQNTLNKIEVVLLLGIMAGFSALIMFIIPPQLYAIIITLPMIASILNIIASPVNALIRPVAMHYGLSTVKLTAMCSTVAGIAAYFLFSMVSLTSITTLLTLLTIPLNLYIIYQLTKIIKNMHTINPPFAYFMTISMCMDILTSLFVPTAEMIIDPVLNFILSFLTAALYRQCNVLLENPAELKAKEFEILPLPINSEDCPPKLQKAALTGINQQFYSPNFFHTDPHAARLTEKDRTWRQQAASFFGGGAHKATARTYNEKDYQPVLSLDWQPGH